ncbi:MAG: hypothetical protein ACKVW3_05615 [Phycisphaerales bacterium]
MNKPASTHDWNFDAAAVKASELANCCVTYGCEISTSSPLCRFQRFFAMLAQRSSGEWVLYKPGEAMSICHGAAMLHRLEQIKQFLMPMGPQWRSKLQIALGGSEVPAKPEQARDHMFELGIAAALRESGLSPEPAEPDILVKLDGLTLGIACKVLYSRKNVAKQISRARDQIVSSGRPGIIAIDISKLIHDHEHALQAANQELATARMKSLARLTTTEFTRQFSRAEMEVQVLGWLVAHTTQSFADGVYASLSECFPSTNRRALDPRNRYLRSLSQRLSGRY